MFKIKIYCWHQIKLIITYRLSNVLKKIEILTTKLNDSINDLFGLKTISTSNGSSINTQHITEVPSPVVTAKQIKLNMETYNKICDTFIAFDVETTGLNSETDRIIEIGAVVFKNGKVDKVFSSFINPKIPIPPKVSAINHITDQMLATAPTEEIVIPKLADFLNDAIQGNIIMCAHNASFDFSFLCNALTRQGINAHIVYVDTLYLSRIYLKGLYNYKQVTLEKFFELSNPQSHKAKFDAENCGYILLNLLKFAKKDLEEKYRKMLSSKPTPNELEVCAFIQNIIYRHNNNITLTFKRNSNGYVYVSFIYTFIYTFAKFKIAKNRRYIIVNKKCPNISNFITEPCTESEGGSAFLRIYFSSPLDLEDLSTYIYNSFKESFDTADYYLSHSKNSSRFFEKHEFEGYTIDNIEMTNLLNQVKETVYEPVLNQVKEITIHTLKDVKLIKNHNRVPLKDIKRCENDYSEEGYNYWSQGEEKRKTGEVLLSLEYFDKARETGYLCPVLYNSYTMAYRKLKDYNNEILILEEAKKVLPRNSEKWKTREQKAIELLYKQQNSN